MSIGGSWAFLHVCPFVAFFHEKIRIISPACIGAGAEKEPLEIGKWLAWQRQEPGDDQDREGIEPHSLVQVPEIPKYQGPVAETVLYLDGLACVLVVIDVRFFRGKGIEKIPSLPGPFGEFHIKHQMQIGIIGFSLLFRIASLVYSVSALPSMRPTESETAFLAFSCFSSKK